MSVNAEVPLDSYRLAQYSVQVPCYICEQGNSFDSEFCRYCSAPLALSHQSNSQKVRPKITAVIGGSGAGKTVYLGMLLDMLSRRTGALQVTARGAFSITLQQMTVAALSQGRFPGKTPSEPDQWNWVHCQIRGPSRKQPAEVIMPDMAGEAMLEEVEHPFTYRVIRALLQRCSGVTILIDAPALERGEGDHEFFAMKLLSYLVELDDHPKTGWPGRPVAFVLSKADACDGCTEDPEAFAQRHARGLWQHCQERFRRPRFFATSVAGACAARHEFAVGPVEIPLRIEPRGVIEPFEWLLSQMKH